MAGVHQRRRCRRLSSVTPDAFWFRHLLARRVLLKEGLAAYLVILDGRPPEASDR